MNSKTRLVEHFFSGTGLQYDRMASLGTLGCDHLWKKKILEQIPEGSKRIMDQACGTGILTFKIARKFPESQITGVELRNEYLLIAKERAKILNLKNVDFILGRAEDVLLDERFDCITSSYLAKYAEMGLLIRNIHKMLREGGTLIMHDFTYPSVRIFALIWEIYFTCLRTLGHFKYPRWKTIFDELPALLRKTKWVDDLVCELKKNHFSEIRVQRLTFGAAAVVTAQKSS